MNKKFDPKDLDIISILFLFVSLAAIIIGLPMLSVEMEKSADFRNNVWVVLGILIFIILIILYLYLWRKIVKYKNFISGARSNIDIQLAKRHHLINGLLGIIKKYLLHEKNNLELRKKKQDFNILMEKYPDLKADKLFVELIDTLSDCENEIAATREIFNENVLHYNKIIQTFPGNVIAVINGYEQIGFWTDEE